MTQSRDATGDTPFRATGVQVRIAADGSSSILVFTDRQERTLSVAMPVAGLRAIRDAVTEVIDFAEGFQRRHH